MGYNHDPGPDPIRDALRAITGEEPPDYVRGYTTEVSDDLADDLQGWACIHARPHWSTGIGILDAADKLVEEAVANANIPPPTQVIEPCAPSAHPDDDGAEARSGPEGVAPDDTETREVRVDVDPMLAGASICPECGARLEE